MTEEELIAFEKDIADEYNKGVIKAPVHLSGGNEHQLIEYFARHFRTEDWVCSTWRSHYHALLAGIPSEKVRAAILEGRSITLAWAEHRFLSSAIVGGVLPIALGIALGIKRVGRFERVHVFVGDMTARTGAFHECIEYAEGHKLPISFVVENNKKSVKTDTGSAWGSSFLSYWMPAFSGEGVIGYDYELTWPHSGTGTWVNW